MIPNSRPDVGDAELERIREAVDSGWIGLGPKVAEFESAFGDRYGYRNVVATNSCTAALDLALESSPLSGSEVLVPAITFVSTAHAARYNDLDVTFVDVRPETLNMDPASLERRISDETAAVVPVHYGGQPAEMDRIVAVAHAHDSVVVEDAAQATGATIDGEAVGTVGDVGCFSFGATKPLTTGQGGALVTDDDDVADEAARLSRLGVDRTTHDRFDDDGYDWYYEVTDVGYKYFMHDVAAAMGLAQLERQPELRARRAAIADRYREAFADLDAVSPLETKPNVTHARFNNTVLVPPGDRNDLLAHLGDDDVAASVHFMPLYEHPLFDSQDPDLPTTEAVWPRILTLPMSAAFDDRQIDRVIDSVTGFYR